MLPHYFSGNRRLALCGLVLMGLIQASLAIITAFKMRELFSTLSEGVHVIPFELVGIIAACSLGVIVVRIAERALAENTGNDYTMDLRLKLFSHLSRISQDRLDHQQQGAINIRFIGDLNAIKNWVSLGIPRLIAAGILFPALMYLLHWLHPVVFLFSLVVFCVAVVSLFLLQQMLLPFHRDVRNKRGNIASYMNERIRFAPQLRIGGQRNKTASVLRKKSQRLKTAAVKKSIVSNSFKAIPDIALAAITAGCFALAFHLQMSTADVAVILAILAIFSQPLKDVAGFWDRRNAFNVASRKCLQILNTPSVTKGQKLAPKNLQQPDIETTSLKLKALYFAKQKINFGEKILIQGKNGCGKSSYLKIVAGLTPPDKGTVKIGGVNVLTIPEKLRSQLIFYQGTEVAIFKSTFKQALLLQNRSAVSDEVLLETVENFGLSGTLSRLGGLNGKVQESGRNLSAGERKKVALCRAWLSDSKILVLDEIDDALDEASLSLVDKVMNKPDTSVLLISHRNLDHKRFDRVIRLGEPIITPFMA